MHKKFSPTPYQTFFAEILFLDASHSKQILIKILQHYALGKRNNHAVRTNRKLRILHRIRQKQIREVDIF